jgi:PAS domain S-box-containing protein
MKDPKDLPPDLTDLRRRAEEQLAAEAISPEELSPAKAARLIHELRVHQIELEMQNEELRLSQARLEESRSKYADLYDFAPVGYLTLDPRGKIVEANLTAATLLGVERRKLLGRFFTYFLVEADRMVFRQVLNNGLNQRERRGEFHLKDGNGDVRIMLLDILFLMDAEGREQRRIALTDITELKRTQGELRLHKEDLEEQVAQRTAELIETNEQLREANDNLEALFKAAPLAIGVFDAEGKILQVNPASERIFGWSLEELKGRLPPSMPTEAPEESLAVLQRVLQGESFTGMELKQQRQDGSLFDASLSAAPLYDAQGDPRGFIGLAEDISERKKLEEAARTQARVLESMAEGVAVTDTRGQIVYTNPAFDAMFGYKTGELLGRHSNILNFYPPEANAGLIKDMLRSVEITGVWAGELHNCRKNGKPFFTSARISAVEAGGKKLFISVQEDITGRKRAEEMLRRQAELLNLAHDAVLVRNPKGRIMYWNQGAASCYGWSTEAALGQVSHKLLKTAFPQPQTEIERHLMEHGYWEGELVHTTRQGQHLVMSSRWSVKRDEKGSVAAILEIHRDITAQKRIEKEVHRLASFPLLNPNPVLEVDEDGQIVYANPAARRIAGNLRLAAGEKAFLPPNLQEIFATARRGGPREYSFDMRVKETVFAMSLHLPHDLPTARLYLMDITERKKADEALKAAHLETVREKNRLEAVMEALPVGLAILDERGGHLRANSTFEQVWGGNRPLPQEVSDYGAYKAWWLDTGQPVQPGDWASACAVREGQAVFDQVMKIQRFDGTYGFVLNSAAPILDAEGKVAECAVAIQDITGLKQAEEALRVSENRFRAFMDNSPTIAWAKDEAGRIVYLDKTFENRFGVRLADCQGKTDFELFPQDMAEEFRKGDLAVLTSGQPLEFIEETVNPDGGRCNWLIFKFTFEDAGGKRYVGGIGVDITERRRAEEALRESLERLRLAGRATNDVIWDWDVVNDQQLWNEAGTVVFGWEDIVKQPQTAAWWTERLHPDDLERVAHGFHAVLDNPAETRWEDEYWFRKKDGSYARVYDRAYVMRNHQGEPVRMIGAMLDLTERKQAEEALRQSEAKSRRQFAEIELLYKSAPVGLCFMDRDLRFVRINKRLAEINGIPVEEHLGRTLREVLPELAPLVEEQFKRIMETGEPVLEVEITGTTPAQPAVRRTWMEQWLPLQDEAGQVIGISIVVEEITERKRAEAALQESEARLRLALDAAYVISFEWDIRQNQVRRFTSTDPTLAPTPEQAPSTFEAVRQAVHPEDRELFTANVLAALSSEDGRYENEFRVVHPDGEAAWLLERGYVERDEQGRPARLIGLSQNITRRRQAEEERARLSKEVAEERDKLRALVESITDEVWYCDTAGNLRPMNRAAARAFGREWLEDHGEPLETFMNVFDVRTADGRPRPLEEAPLLRSLRGETVRELEETVLSPTGLMAYRLVSTAPIRDRDGLIVGAVGVGRDITDHKQAEAALQESEERYRSLFENNHAVMLLIDPETGAIVDANPAACDYYGSSREDLLARRIYDLNTMSPEQVSFEMEQAKAEKRKHFEFKHRLASGEIRDVEVFSGPIRIKGRELLYSIVHDITARKEAEAALRESEARYRAIGELIPYGIWTAEPDGAWRYVSQSFLKMTGKTLEESRGHGWMNLLPDEDVQPTREAWQHCLETGCFWDYEYMIRGKDGRYRTILSRGLPLADSEGRITSWVGINLDITERKEMEEALRRAHDQLEQRVAERTATLRLTNDQLVWEIEERQQAESRLRESEARFAAFMEHLPGLAVMRDIQGRYLFANHAWEKMMGLEPGAWKGKTLTEVWPADQAKTLTSLDFEVISSGKPIEKVEMLELAAGPRYFLANVFPIGGREGLSYMIGGIAIDVTARQEAEEALAEYAAQVHDLYNHAPCGYHSLDSESAIVQINDTELAWLGYTREEVVGRLKFPDLLTPASQKVFRENFPRFKARGFVKDLEYEMVRKDGTILPVSLSATVVRDEAGNYVMSRGTIYDITDRKRAEEALKEKEAMLRLILDTLPVGVWVTDREGRIVQGNPAGQRIWKGARYVGIDDYGDYQGWWADSGKKIEPQEWALARAVQKGETSLGEVVNIQCFDDSRKTIINSAVPLFGEKHDILGAIVVNQDITAMVRAEEVMQEQARQLEAFFAHSLTPLVFLDPHFNFLRVNEAYARACHRHVQDFIGHNLFEFYPHAENQAIFNEVVRTKTPFQVQAKAFEFPDHPEWGVTYWDWSLAPMLDQAGEVDFLVFSLRDVTRRVLSEQARNRLIEILEATPDFVGIADYYGNLQYLNRAGRAMVGVGEDEDVSSLKVLDLHPERIGNLILREGSQTAMREGAWQAELALLHRDGREIPVSQVILAHKDPSGRVGFFSTVARDISEMKQAQESILRQAAILNGINRIFREALTCETREDLGQTCLSMAEALTDSRFGFIDLLNEDGSLDFLAVSDPARETCRQAGKKGSKLPGHVSCRGIFQAVIKEGASLITNAPASHPDWRGLPAGHLPLASYLGVPLKHGRQVMGQIGLGNRENGYSQREQEAVETLAPAIMEALMHRRAEEALMASERRLRYLADQLLTAQENERKRLAAELHDELGHALLTLKLSLSSVARDLLPEQEMLREEIKAQLAYINEVIGEVRRLYHDLSPGDVDDLGLTLALQALVENFAALQEHLTCEADLPPLDRLFPLPVQTIIYRIVQEALTNIGKHADPEHVTVSARVEGSQVHFTVQDDGRGFDVSQVLGAPSRGIGLAAMEERLNMVGGSFEIHSREQVGTKLCFTVPIHKLDP